MAARWRATDDSAEEPSRTPWSRAVDDLERPRADRLAHDHAHGEGARFRRPVFISGRRRGTLAAPMSVDETGGSARAAASMLFGLLVPANAVSTSQATRANVSVISPPLMPSVFCRRFRGLVDAQSREVTGRGGTESRALNAPRGSSVVPAVGLELAAEWNRRCRLVDRVGQWTLGIGPRQRARERQHAVRRLTSGGKRKRLAKEAQPSVRVSEIRLGPARATTAIFELARGIGSATRIGEGSGCTRQGEGSKRVAHTTFDHSLANANSHSSSPPSRSLSKGQQCSGSGRSLARSKSPGKPSNCGVPCRSASSEWCPDRHARRTHGSHRTGHGRHAQVADREVAVRIVGPVAPGEIGRCGVVIGIRPPDVGVCRKHHGVTAGGSEPVLKQFCAETFEAAQRCVESRSVSGDELGRRGRSRLAAHATMAKISPYG
ncbi:hypothetical protein FQR65_LT19717 [Abscondita terminalis]|nr:hypothetical protein FQR65_LT19717 [Abscondita terminalis]